MNIKNDKRTGLFYWGAMPLPDGADMIGTIERDGNAGALIRLRTGWYVQGNAGSMRSLDQRQVQAVMEEIRHERQGTRED